MTSLDKDSLQSNGHARETSEAIWSLFEATTKREERQAILSMMKKHERK